MAIRGSKRVKAGGTRSALIAVVSVLTGFFGATGAEAERSTFKTYATDLGLTSLDGGCITHDGAGQILICSEHGVFTYDGRRFVNLGAEHGLPQDGIVSSIVLAPSGRVAVLYSDEVYVSDQGSDASHPVTSLSFSPVDHPGISLYDRRPHRITPWRDGFVLLAGDASVSIVAATGHRARIASMGYDFGERALLQSATAIFSVQGRFWESFDDGRLCNAEPGNVRCYDAKDGLANGPWVDLIAGPGGRLLARSADAVATFDPASDRWSSVTLPDQGGKYQGDTANLGLYMTPSGSVITQAAQGLDILDPGGWREMTVADGAPDGTVFDAMTDGAGQLWFHMMGRGLVRWVGFGHWDTIEKADGLSQGLSWETVRSGDGTLWVSTDSGVDELTPQGLSLRVSKVYPGGSYALAVTSNGDVWAGYGGKGARVIEPKTGLISLVDSPGVETIVPERGHTVWLGTAKGLYKVDDSRGPPFQAVSVKIWATPVQSIVQDGGEGVYYLSGDHLHHWHANGSDIIVSGPGWTDKLEPMSLAIAHDGSLWIGGPRGLSHLAISGDRIRSYETIPTEDVGTTTIYAVMIDHRGWVWVGTSLGISVYNGKRWVSVDANHGLLSNDVSEDGIREDPDGSVWVSTTSGVSHLRDPVSLFVERPLSVTVTEVHVGSRPVGSSRLPYTNDPLSIDLSTSNYGLERSVLFRHRLSGVDADWVSSSSGTVSYPFVPPGRHVFTVIGYDQLAHRMSEPATVSIDVSYPWWRRWWSEALWAALAVGLIHAAVRVRYRAMYMRQAELKRHVAQATEQLRYQASHDKLTGLLNRSEIETRLAEKLTKEHAGEELVVALLDVDHFKRINDKHGHLGGDEILRALGRSISRAMRRDEYAGRYGGEELLLVLTDTDGCAAERVLDLHLSIRHDIFRVGDDPVRVTCSIGVAWADSGDNWETIVGRADAALYEAKDAGRDRVVESRSHNARVPSDG